MGRVETQIARLRNGQRLRRRSAIRASGGSVGAIESRSMDKNPALQRRVFAGCAMVLRRFALAYSGWERLLPRYRFCRQCGSSSTPALW